MQDSNNRGFLFAAQDFEEWVKVGKIVGIDPSKMSEQITSASVDLRISNEAWIVEREIATSLRWARDIRSELKSLPASKCKHITFNAEKPCIIEPGFSYIVPCNEIIHLDKFQKGDLSTKQIVTNSPKSTSARKFEDVRVFFEGRSQFDETHNVKDKPVIVKPWILLDPTHFRSYLYPGLDLTQLRISQGVDTKLSAQEILEEHKKYGIVNIIDEKGNITPIETLDIDPNNNIRIRLNLRSRDGKKFAEKITIHPKQGYLLESKEYLRVPSHLSLEMIQYSASAIRTITHKGGYFDPGFEGTVIGEVESVEDVSRDVHDGEHIYLFAVHRHREPTIRPYGNNSNYQKQIGARYSKNFDPAIVDPKTIIGWVTKKTDKIMDLRKKAHQNVFDFYDPIVK